MTANHDRNELVIIALRRITHAIDVHSRAVFLKHNLTGPQLFLMREISRHEGITADELASLVEIGETAVDDILDRLEKRGLVRRNPGDQLGISPLTVTEEGEGILRQSPPLLKEQFFQEFEKLNEWEQSLVLSTLQRVAAMLEQGENHQPETDVGRPLSESAPAPPRESV